MSQTHIEINLCLFILHAGIETESRFKGKKSRALGGHIKLSGIVMLGLDTAIITCSRALGRRSPFINAVILSALSPPSGEKCKSLFHWSWRLKRGTPLTQYHTPDLTSLNQIPYGELEVILKTSQFRGKQFLRQIHSKWFY